MGSLEGTHPMLAQRFLALQRAAAAAGHQIGITSGRRSVEEQISLRRRNGCPDIWTSPASSCRVPTAIPGRSNHNSGLAIDMSGNAAAKAWVAQNAASFGLHLPVAGEDWHLEMIGDGEAASVMSQFPDAIGFDMQWATQAGDPDAAIDQRLDAIMGAIGGANADVLAEMGATASPAEDPMLSSPASDPMLGTEGTESVTATPQMGIDTTLIPSEDEFTRLRQVDTTLGQPPGGVPTGGEFAGNVPPPGYIPPGDDPVERWRGVFAAALAYTGQDMKWLDLGMRRLRQESGGNPGIVNDWDINAKRGDPSIGLMQNIGSAFPERARELSGRGIRDGFANIVASIRYTLQRYGTLAAWGRPGGY